VHERVRNTSCRVYNRSALLTDGYTVHPVDVDHNTKTQNDLRVGLYATYMLPTVSVKKVAP